MAEIQLGAVEARFADIIYNVQALSYQVMVVYYSYVHFRKDGQIGHTATNSYKLVTICKNTLFAGKPQLRFSVVFRFFRTVCRNRSPFIRSNAIGIRTRFHAQDEFRAAGLVGLECEMSADGRGPALHGCLSDAATDGRSVLSVVSDRKFQQRIVKPHIDRDDGCPGVFQRIADSLPHS